MMDLPKPIFILICLIFTLGMSACGSDSKDCANGDLCSLNTQPESIDQGLDSLFGGEGEKAPQDQSAADSEAENEEIDETIVDLEEEIELSDVEKILNPDNCTPAQLSALSELSNQTEETGNILPRTITGLITLEKPSQNDNGTLNYSDIETVDAYGLDVQAIACDGSEWGGNSDFTNRVTLEDPKTQRSINYELRVPSNIDVNLRISSRGGMRTSGYVWNISVENNLSIEDAEEGICTCKTGGSGADPYFIDIPETVLASSTIKIVDINIPLKWDGSNYGEGSSQPFAILDQMNKAMYELLQYKEPPTSGPIIVSNTQVFWSELNVAIEGDITRGNVGGAHYNPINNAIYLLGKIDIDTDEFDDDVIVKTLVSKLQYDVEYGGRNDAISLMPPVDGVLDPRDSFSEGFSKAQAVRLVAESDYFRNSAGPAQASVDNSLSFGLENNNSGLTEGFYDSLSVARVVYDFLDGDTQYYSSRFDYVAYSDTNVDDDDIYLNPWKVFQAYQDASSSKAFATVHTFLSSIQRTRFQDSNSEDDIDDSFLADPSKLGKANIEIIFNEIAESENISLPNDQDDNYEDEADVAYEVAINGVEEGVIDVGTFAATNDAGSYATNEDDDKGLQGFIPYYTNFGLVGVPFMFTDEDSGITYNPRGFDSVDVQTVCSFDNFGVNNTLGNRRFITFQVFDKTKFEDTSGFPDSTPDINIVVEFNEELSDVDETDLSVILYADGVQNDFADSVINNALDVTPNLAGNAYVLELTTLDNLGYGEKQRGKACYDIRIFDALIDFVQ